MISLFFLDTSMMILNQQLQEAVLCNLCFPTIGSTLNVLICPWRWAGCTYSSGKQRKCWLAAIRNDFLAIKHGWMVQGLLWSPCFAFFSSSNFPKHKPLCCCCCCCWNLGSSSYSSAKASETVTWSKLAISVWLIAKVGRNHFFQLCQNRVQCFLKFCVQIKTMCDNIPMRILECE